MTQFDPFAGSTATATAVPYTPPPATQSGQAPAAPGSGFTVNFGGGGGTEDVIAGSGTLYYGADGTAWRWNPNTQQYDRVPQMDRAPSGGSGGTSGGARGPTPEELALSYARLDQDQQQMGQQQAQFQQNYELAVRNQNFDEAAYWYTQIQNSQQQQADLDYRYAALDAQTQITYDQMAMTLGRDEANRQFQSAQAEADRQFQMQMLGSQQGFAAGENALDRQLQVYMQQDAQAYQSGENSADRELRLQMQANDLGFAREQLDFAKYQFAAKYGLEKAYFDLQKGQLTLQAAAQFAELISSTDPQAVNAFLMAGGGNISNALAAGATAVSNEAMLPAAMTLRQAREYEAMQAPELPPYPTSTAPQGNFTAPQAVRQQAPATYAPAPSLAVTPAVTPATPPGGVAVPSAAAAPASASPQTQLQVGAQVNPSGTFTGDEFSARRAYVNAAAAGNPAIYAQAGFNGTVTRPTTFTVAEPGPQGQPRPEQVTVRPLTPQSQAYMAHQTAAYQPEIGEVRALRESTPVNPPVAGGYYNVAFRTVAPTQQELYMKSLQTRYGVPIRDVIAEANRYALSGIRRGGIRVGY